MSVYIPVAVRRVVRERAGNCCEYCRISQRAERRPFEMDHTRPLRHGGRTVAENLAFACAPCNLWKGPNLTAFDPAEDRPEFLFDPRRDVWADHFELRGGAVAGLTPTSRATVAFLKMNEPARVRLRARSLVADGSDPA